MKLVIFVHVGKTGGTSTSAYLKKAVASIPGWDYESTGHAPAHLIKEAYGAKDFDKALKFSIVRHPVDRYISACRQCYVDANDPKTWERIRLGIHPNENVMTQDHIFVTQVKSTFVDGIKSCKIFNFERDLPHAVHSWLKEQGLNLREFPHKLPDDPGNVSKQELTSESLAFVKDFYACDFEAFGYEP